MLDIEIVESFQEECRKIIAELTAVVEQLEESADAGFPASLLSDFSQKIDRIMGAAQTLSMADPENGCLIRIGKIAELCKRVGYKAAEQKNPKLLPIFTAFWADTIEVMEELVESIRDQAEAERVAASYSKVLQGRLEWLSKQVQPQGAANLPQGAVDLLQLGKDLGLTG
jgi:hypothetical protein